MDCGKGVMEQEVPEYRNYARVKEELNKIDKSIKGEKLDGTNREETLLSKKKSLIEELYSLEKDGNFYENISELSPQFVISMCLAITLMKKAGVNTVKIPDLLLLRYDNKLENKGEEYANAIQKRCTEQLIRTCRRAMYHMPNAFKRVSYPMEEEESFTVVGLNPNESHWEANNPFLSELIDLVRNSDVMLDKDMMEK